MSRTLSASSSASSLIPPADAISGPADAAGPTRSAGLLRRPRKRTRPRARPRRPAEARRRNNPISSRPAPLPATAPPEGSVSQRAGVAVGRAGLSVVVGSRVDKGVGEGVKEEVEVVRVAVGRAVVGMGEGVDVGEGVAVAVAGGDGVGWGAVGRGEGDPVGGGAGEEVTVTVGRGVSVGGRVGRGVGEGGGVSVGRGVGSGVGVSVGGSAVGTGVFVGQGVGVAVGGGVLVGQGIPVAEFEGTCRGKVRAGSGISSGGPARANPADESIQRANKVRRMRFPMFLSLLGRPLEAVFPASRGLGLAGRYFQGVLYFRPPGCPTTTVVDHLQVVAA